MQFRKFTLAVLIVFAGCDLNKGCAQVSARKVMVATLLSTPAIVIPPQAIAGFDGGLFGFDGGLPDFDGGFPFDAGGFDAGGLPISFGDGGITIAAQTAMFVFFGTRTGDGLTEAPTGVAGATLKASSPTKSWTLNAQEGGTHTLTSQDDATLAYENGVTWNFTAEAETLTFEGEVGNTPTPENIAQLHPAQGYIDLAAGTDYVLTRPDPEDPNQERNLGFVTVFPISSSGSQGEPTYTNVPTTPLGFLKLAAAPGDWKTTIVTIPGSAFPLPGKNYVILVQSATLGGAKTSNLFIGSPMIAGVADVGVVKTH